MRVEIDDLNRVAILSTVIPVMVVALDPIMVGEPYRKKDCRKIALYG